jgi:subtilisin
MGVHRGAVSLLAALLLVVGVPPALAHAPDDESIWLVTLAEDHPSARHAERMARRHGGTVRHLYEHALNGFAFQGSERSARNLERHPGVQRVTPDQPVHAASDVIPWGVSRIDATVAHSQGHDGAGVRIAILDTGVDASHPAIDVDETLGKNCIDTDTSSTTDVHGHGTHVAGTASATLLDGEFVGAATRASIVPVKVLGDSGSGSWASVICGVDHVSKYADAIGVANLSLSGAGTAGADCDASELRSAICRSVDRGVTYTVAAGNAATDVSASVPAAFPEVVTVSALDDDRCVRRTGGGPPRTSCDEGLASFSNYGSGVDITAPGVRIYSTVPGGMYGTKSGTSMAAPHVAGVAALMLAVDDTLTPAVVRDLLQGTGECPDGRQNQAPGGSCAGQGQWIGDPDGIAEPLLNALRAAEAASDPPDPTDEDPVADFSYSCDDLSCSFTDVSTGAGLDTWSWDFGDGAISEAQHPEHAYGDAGEYPVRLTVTDTEGRSDTATQLLTVAASEDEQPEDPDGGIELSAWGYKERGLQKADLSWAGAASDDVDVLRDGTKITTAANTGAWTDDINQRGSGTYSYRVCEAGTATCSDEVAVVF